MKIAVTGNGGVGKTSIAWMLAEIYAKNCPTLTVDADPTLNLSSGFGVEDITPIGQMKDLVEERARLPDGLVRMNPYVKYIIDEYAVAVRGYKNLRLLAVGTVTKAGSGCLCPENALLRSLLQEIMFGREEYVVVDMEAGFEHMSRGTLRHVDVIMVVTEPTKNSIEVAKKLVAFTKELGVTNAIAIANKIQNDGESKYVSNKLNVFHEIPYDPELKRKSMENERIGEDSVFYKSIKELSEKISGDFT